MMLETTVIPLLNMELRDADNRHYLEGIAVPWGRRTDRVAKPELFERGAFADLVTAQAKVKLTDYNHSHSRVPVGYSTAIEDRAEGLWLRFRLNQTPEGRSAHENAVEGVYGGLSVGFIARQERTVDGVRHVQSARLDHVSLVENPAYEDAVITDLRGASDAQIAEWRALIAAAPSLDSREHKSQNLLIAEFRQKMGSHN